MQANYIPIIKEPGAGSCRLWDRGGWQAGRYPWFVGEKGDVNPRLTPVGLPTAGLSDAPRSPSLGIAPRLCIPGSVRGQAPRMWLLWKLSLPMAKKSWKLGPQQPQNLKAPREWCHIPKSPHV